MCFVIFVIIVYELDYVLLFDDFCVWWPSSVCLQVDLSLSKGYTGARCHWPIRSLAEHTGLNKGKGQAATQPSHCLGASQVSLLADEGGQPFQKNSFFQLNLISYIYSIFFILYIFCFCFHLLCLIFSGFIQTGYTSFSLSFCFEILDFQRSFLLLLGLLWRWYTSR